MLCDNAKRCSLVTLPSLVGLSPDVDLKGEDMVKAAEKMEELQSKYPSVDLSHLTDLSKVKAYVESLDLFSEPFTAEVTEFSRLKWMATAEDTYVLQIPEKRELQGQFARYLHEKLTIETNELDEYVLSITTTQTDKQLGVYSTLKEAFESADDVVVRCRSDRMALLTRTAEWHQASVRSCNQDATQTWQGQPGADGKDRRRDYRRRVQQRNQHASSEEGITPWYTWKRRLTPTNRLIFSLRDTVGNTIRAATEPRAARWCNRTVRCWSRSAGVTPVTERLNEALLAIQRIVDAEFESTDKAEVFEEMENRLDRTGGITTMTTDERITILKDAIMGLVEVCRIMNEQGAKQDKRIADLESREALNTFNWL
jgi:hypothetical protein